jgi:hypothetical protein
MTVQSSITASHPNSPRDRFFRSHYSEEVQAAIPFMHLRDQTPLVEAFSRAGFSHRST